MLVGLPRGRQRQLRARLTEQLLGEGSRVQRVGGFVLWRLAAISHGSLRSVLRAFERERRADGAAPTLTAGTHYGDPASGCLDDEDAIVAGGGRVFAWRGARRAGATDLGILDYSQHLDRPKLLELSPQLVLGRFTAQPPDE